MSHTCTACSAPEEGGRTLGDVEDGVKKTAANYGVGVNGRKGTQVRGRQYWEFEITEGRGLLGRKGVGMDFENKNCRQALWQEWEFEKARMC